MSGVGDRGWGVLPVGSVVAGYRVERLLGVGGMGAVYVVANPELPRRDALKVLSAALSHNEEFQTRFVREADVASMLDHPNIVSIYRRGRTDDGLLWIAMQLVDGTDADAALKSGTMTPARAVYVVSEVAKALDFAHAHQVVHRDIKPANFLLAGVVGEERVLLGDFGIARGLDDAGLTATGSLMATVAYTAPEVLAGGTFDARADLYSLGCTLFRLLTGKTPYFTANGPAAVMMAHLQAPPPRLSDVVGGLPPALDGVIAKAMAKDPAQRFGSARELADAASSLVHTTTRLTTRPWQPVPAAAVSAYRDAPPTGPQWWQQTGGHPTQQGFAAAPTQWGAPVLSPPPVRPRRRRGLILGAMAATVLLAGAAVGVVTLAHHSKGNPKAAPSQAVSTTSAPPPAVSTSSTPSPSPVAPLPPSALDNLLPTPEEVAQIMGATKLAIFKATDKMTDETGVIDRKQCLGAFAPEQAPVYVETGGWTAVRAQAVHEPGDVPIAFEVFQAVIELPTAAVAENSLTAQTAQWASCSGTEFTTTYPNSVPVPWKFGPLTAKGNLLSMMQLPVKNNNPATGPCQRAVAVQNNMVADVWACRIGISNQAVDLANAILAKIPH
ncbi:serine/threonine-protein kinase PknH/PknJ [Mycobacterium sp.]|uniref:serine/threonine-protein kinase PknH/PknJ n=1 Tax=Mycobacterium sp. TaxID=1785 RepID=UPI003D0DC4CF